MLKIQVFGYILNSIPIIVISTKYLVNGTNAFTPDLNFSTNSLVDAENSNVSNRICRIYLFLKL